MASENIESQWTNEGFNKRFEEILQANKIDSEFTYTKAYEQAEKEHVEKFGKLRYASYESFRSCRRALLFTS
jgi:hypothetical protein